MSYIKPSEHDQNISVSPLSTSGFDSLYGIFGISLMCVCIQCGVGQLKYHGHL